MIPQHPSTHNARDESIPKLCKSSRLIEGEPESVVGAPFPGTVLSMSVPGSRSRRRLSDPLADHSEHTNGQTVYNTLVETLAGTLHALPLYIKTIDTDRQKRDHSITLQPWPTK